MKTTKHEKYTSDDFVDKFYISIFSQKLRINFISIMANYLEMTKDQFVEFNKFPADTKLSMLNLLKFKVKDEVSGKIGEERYMDYMKAANPFFIKSNAKVVYMGKAQSTLIGPDNEWDKVLIIEYAKKSDFITMVMSEGYPSHIRTQALSDSRLIFCEPMN